VVPSLAAREGEERLALDAPTLGGAALPRSTKDIQPAELWGCADGGGGGAAPRSRPSCDGLRGLSSEAGGGGGPNSLDGGFAGLVAVSIILETILWIST